MIIGITMTPKVYLYVTIVVVKKKTQKLCGYPFYSLRHTLQASNFCYGCDFWYILRYIAIKPNRLRAYKYRFKA